MKILPPRVLKGIYLREARRELLDARHYYEQRQPGLGGRFVNEVRALEASLRGNSAAPIPRHALYRPRPGDYQRVNLRGFPYYLPYLLWQERLHILAVAHASREPEYWIGRKLP